MPRWIDQQARKAERLKEGAKAHAVLLDRHLARRAEEADIDARSKALELARVPEPKGRGARPGERLLPDLSDEDLAVALGRADPVIPRHLDYPHLLILRSRGLTRMVWADTGAGEFGVPTYRGDVLSEDGRQWLMGFCALSAGTPTRE